MRSILLFTLTFIGLSSTAFAKQGLALNCAADTNEAYIVKTLQDWTNAPATGVIITDVQAGIDKAQAVLSSKSLNTLVDKKTPIVAVRHPKIIRIETIDNNFKRVCVIIEGEILNRLPPQ